MSFLRNIFFLILITFLFTSCYQDPKYPSVPLISFQDIESSAGNIADTVRITIQIQDREGDLGLTSFEDAPKFQTIDADGNRNPFYHNFFIQTFRQTQDNFTLVDFPDGQELHGRFPRFLAEPGKNTMEITLTYEFLVYFVFGSPVEKGDTLRFNVQISDRSLNLSNMITTESIVLGK